MPKLPKQMSATIGIQKAINKIILGPGSKKKKAPTKTRKRSG
jgi:hypothetical protein